jgi:hypothetical protein
MQMKVLSRRALLVDLLFVFSLPFTGCGGEPLKPLPDGAAPALPPPETEAEYHKRDLELKKATTKSATNTGRPTK